MTSPPIHGSIAPLHPPVRRADTVWLEDIARELLAHPLDTALAAGIVQSYLDALPSPMSRRTLASALDLFASTASGDRCAATELPWWRLLPHMVVVVRHEITDRSRAHSTSRRIMSACRSVFQLCHDRGLIDAARLRDLVDAARSREPPELVGRVLSSAETDRLLTSCSGGDMLALRDGVVLALLLAHLQPREVIDLAIEDWSTTARTLHIRGRHERTITLSARHAELLDAWLERRGQGPGPLLIPLLRGRRRGAGRKLSLDTVRAIVRARSVRAGLRRLSPRDLRRSALVRAFEEGWSPTEVAASAGLSDAKGLRAHRRRARR